MSEWHHSKNRHYSDFRKLLQEPINKANPRRKLVKDVLPNFLPNLYSDANTYSKEVSDEII